MQNTIIMFDRDLLDLVEQIKERMVARHLTISVAESCTGGLLSSCLTAIEGASNYFSYGFVTYSNQAKISLLNIPSQIIEQFGSVSKEVAESMAIGAMNKAKSSIAIAITGIAGPGGGALEKPVGTVWITITCSAKVVPDVSPDKQQLRESLTKAETFQGLTSIKRNFITKSYLSVLSPINPIIPPLDNRQMIRYLSCQKALKIILRHIT